ncbi:hypothetical protein FPV67DRAFT_1664553 [Lyophyllum atratum]|nr:hypothetical protein FPV67DRAFT_1664553 [Lyophyllum atratum]
MKPVSFLRNTWRKRDNKSSTKTQSAHRVEPALLEVQSPSPLLKPAFGEAASVFSLEFDSTFQDPQSNITGRVLVNGSENWESIHAQIVPRLRGKHGSLFHSSHGPPHNPSHGPRSLNIGTQALRSGTSPHRPPRPPSLNLSSQPPSVIPRSPTRVKFAPDPPVRPSHPTSPLRQAFPRVGRTNRSSSVPDSSKDSDTIQDCQVQEVAAPDVDEKLSDYSGNSPAKPTGLAPSPFSDTPNMAPAVLDLSDAPVSKSLYHASSSAPHLPLPQQRSRRPNTEPRDSLRSSRDTLASFPQPPPLRVRKRPRPLVLLPTPTLAQLPPSPLFGSNDSTPVATPTTSRPLNALSSPKSPKYPGRPLHTISPPAYSPPNSPLPAPPTSSGFVMPFDREKHSGRALRTAQSTSELRAHRFGNLYPSHRATSSAPASDLFTTREATKKVVHPLLTSHPGSDSQTVEPHGLSTPHQHSVHWEYAV